MAELPTFSPDRVRFTYYPWSYIDAHCKRKRHALASRTIAGYVANMTEEAGVIDYDIAIGAQVSHGTLTRVHGASDSTAPLMSPSLGVMGFDLINGPLSVIGEAYLGETTETDTELTNVLRLSSFALCFTMAGIMYSKKLSTDQPTTGELQLPVDYATAQLRKGVRFDVRPASFGWGINDMLQSGLTVRAGKIKRIAGAAALTIR